jgi:tetratricopeptide (TPR) repeat protein
MSFGDFERAQDYARLAVDTRPDLPEAYDALIIVTVLPVAIEIQENPGKAAEVFPDLLDEKIANTGGTAYDYAVLAAVEFFRYPNTDAANREAVLKQMKAYADKSLANDANNPTALLNLGNYYILRGEYESAIAVNSDAYVAADPDKKPLFLNNRGIAKLLAGDREGGIADLKKALDTSDGNDRSSEALAVLGVE